MSYRLINVLPDRGIFWKLTREQKDYLVKILENMHLKIGSKQGESTDCNIAWYSSGYYNYIKNKTSLPTLKWNDYFEEDICTPLIFN